LAAVFFDALRGDRRHLATFMAASNWPRDDLSRRGLLGMIEFQFNAVAAIVGRVDLAKVRSLEELGQRLFADSNTT